MPTFPTSPDSLPDDFGRQLIDEGATETLTLEFKSAPYAAGPDGSREFLKDIAAFANTRGGWLFIGIREARGVAVELTPVADPDPDKHQQRLQSLIQSGIEPRLLGVRMRPLKSDGGHVLAVHVPRSAYPPHRVTAQNSNRFYLRNSSGVYEASMSELRGLFDEAGAVRDRAIRFRDDRLAMINSGTAHILLAPGSDRLVLHIQPLASEVRADLRAAQTNEHSFKPLGDISGFTPRFNVDGFVTLRGGEHCHGYTQIFRTGELEATKVGVVGAWHEALVLPARHIEEILEEAVPRYLRALDLCGVFPPYIVSTSIMGVSEAYVAIHDRPGMFFRAPPVLRAPDLLLPVCVVEAMGSSQEIWSYMRPALDALWNAGGALEWQPKQP